MGFPVSVHAFGTDRFVDAEQTDAAVRRASAALHEVDRVFSPYREDSDITRLRRGDLDLADAHASVRGVLEACERAETATGGLFSARWQGWFDPTGYVKGWAVEQAFRDHLEPLLSRPGATAIGINAGGDMQLATAPGSDWTWNIGIADPVKPGHLLATVAITSGAVATSGTSERGAHIIDPRSGLPAVDLTSATVVADSLTTADLWATAAMVAGDDLGWIRRAPTRSGLIVTANGATRRWLGETEVSVTPVAAASGAAGLITPAGAAA